jgi:uncharacterized protein (TIGR00255 family)
MIRSMTGFASLTREEEQATIAITLRAVNHRFLDVQARLPASLADMEPRLRAIVQERIGRGRIELNVNLQLRRPPSLAVELNEPLIEALAAALEQARAKGVITGVLQPGDLLRLPQALAIREKAGADGEGPPEEVRKAIEAAVSGALGELDVMREREGSLLRQDLEGRRATLADLVERIAQAAERGRAPRGARRFRSHLVHWQALADAPEPCGRKLDFLIQEMNREANTIGSKAEGEEAPPIVVAMKAELEKMREQVQNVE